MILNLNQINTVINHVDKIYQSISKKWSSNFNTKSNKKSNKKLITKTEKKKLVSKTLTTITIIKIIINYTKALTKIMFFKKKILKVNTKLTTTIQKNPCFTKLLSKIRIFFLTCKVNKIFKIILCVISTVMISLTTNI